MCHKVLPEEAHSLAERAMFRFAQVWIALPELCGQGTGQFDEPAIAQVGHAQLWHATLSHTNKVTGAAQSHIFFGETKTVIGRFKDVEAFLGLLAGIGAEHITIGLIFAAANAPAKLVKL